MKTNPEFLKKIAALGAAAVLLFVIYLSAYLPFRKSSLFIQTVHSFNSVKSFEEFQDKLDALFNFYSPVGDAEVLRFLAEQFNQINQSNSSPALAEFLVKYTETRFLEYVSGRTGVNVTKELVQLGNLRLNYGLKYKDSVSLEAAERYYLEGLRLSPRRPEFLLALYNLYAVTDQKEKAEEIGRQIITYWPNIKNVR